MLVDFSVDGGGVMANVSPCLRLPPLSSTRRHWSQVPLLYIDVTDARRP